MTWSVSSSLQWNYNGILVLAVLQFQISLTFLQNVNFLWLKIKFPDNFLIFKTFFFFGDHFLTWSNPVKPDWPHKTRLTRYFKASQGVSSYSSKYILSKFSETSKSESLKPYWMFQPSIRNFLLSNNTLWKKHSENNSFLYFSCLWQRLNCCSVISWYNRFMFAFKPCGDKSLQRLDIGLRNDLYKLKTEAA